MRFLGSIRKFRFFARFACSKSKLAGAEFGILKKYKNRQKNKNGE